MGDFKVDFGTEVLYDDPEYQMMIHLNVAGNAEVSCADREGNATDVAWMRDFITSPLLEQFSLLSKEKVPYKELMSRKDAIASVIADALKEKNTVLKAFAFTEIAPNERSQEVIKGRDKLKAFAAMSEDEKNKMLEDAMKAYQANAGVMAAAAKFCTNCGSPANGGKFCSNCGKPL